LKLATSVHRASAKKLQGHGVKGQCHAATTVEML